MSLSPIHFLPLFIGTIIVLQSGINREMAIHLGLAQTILFSSIVALVITVGWFFWVKLYPSFSPDFFHLKGSFAFRWWYLFPGIFGFLIIVLAPFSFFKIGALETVIGIMFAQILVGLLWDVYVEGATVNLYRILAIVFSGVSLVFVALAK